MTLLLIGTIVFLLCLIVPEWQSADWRTRTVSSYLTGKASGAEDSGCVVFAFTLFWLAAHLTGLAMVWAIVVGIGLLGVMTTKRYANLYGESFMAWHVIAAITCFVGADLLMWAVGKYPALSVGYPVAVAVVALISPRNIGLIEKTGISLICTWLICFALGVS